MNSRCHYPSYYLHLAADHQVEIYCENILLLPGLFLRPCRRNNRNYPFAGSFGTNKYGIPTKIVHVKRSPRTVQQSRGRNKVLVMDKELLVGLAL
jgi:hypothetical protein